VNISFLIIYMYRMCFYDTACSLVYSLRGEESLSLFAVKYKTCYQFCDETSLESMLAAYLQERCLSVSLSRSGFVPERLNIQSNFSPSVLLSYQNAVTKFGRDHTSKGFKYMSQVGVKI